MLRRLFALALLAAPGAAQSVLLVDASAAPGGNGTSWGSAFDDLDAALAAAAPGAEVWVAEGTYAGGFDVPDAVRVLGGFQHGQRVATQRRPAQNPTVLDGGGAERVVRLGHLSVLDGFTVRNGLASGLGGGGAVIDSVDATIRNCFFTGNRNLGGRGSALHVRNAVNPLVENTIFFQNGDALSGHVIDINSSNGRYENIVVYDNVENGFHMQVDSNPVIRNSIFGRNTGRGICVISFNDDPIIENNLFFANSISMMHVTGSELFSIGQVNALSYAADNIAGDPLFVDELAGDLRLTAASPCVDNGHAGATPTTPTDFWTNPRVLDGHLNGIQLIDLGAHELGNVHLDVGGSATSGGTLTLNTTGTPGLDVEVWIGLVPTVTPDPPFGTAFFNTSTRRRRIGVGQTPWAGTFKLPGLLFSGVPLVLQAKAVTPGGQAGNWSNPVDLIVN